MGAILAATVCGAVDPSVPLGSLVVFDDLHFLGNRLPDGSLCTLHTDRGRRVAPTGSMAARTRRSCAPPCSPAPPDEGHEIRDGGCYGHVDGPRFNTAAEIRSLRSVGVTAVSQTGGPETVLAGEASIPYALVGYATDYANGVMEEDTAPDDLMRLIAASKDVLALHTRGRPPPPRDSDDLPPVGHQIVMG
ncbi:MAG: hypothetical protein PGN13_00780 [Patulibacter minatonensis]